jgi:hypothetical protein
LYGSDVNYFKEASSSKLRGRPFVAPKNKTRNKPEGRWSLCSSGFCESHCVTVPIAERRIAEGISLLMRKLNVAKVPDWFHQYATRLVLLVFL